MTFRILSLDGGGIRGVISAAILSEVERQIDRPLNQYFDLIAGSSTGSILAAAIAKGLKSEDIIQLYRKEGKRIFPYGSLFAIERLKLLMQYGLSAPKFSDQGLSSVLKKWLGYTQLSEIKQSPRLLITAYDTIEREFIVFKSWREFEPLTYVPVWEACVCSASAPTFFPAHKLEVPLEKGTRTYMAIDGGIGANNPAACAVAEALRLGQPIEKIAVLSIGTGAPKVTETAKTEWQKAGEWGISEWVWQGRLIRVLLDASANVNDYITQQVMSSADVEEKDSGLYLRLQPEIGNDRIDDASQQNIDRLVNVARSFVEERKDKLIKFIQKISV